jgi:hypothetical protein
MGGSAIEASSVESERMGGRPRADDRVSAIQGNQLRSTELTIASSLF